MSSADEIEVMLPQELCHPIRTESIGNASVVLPPAPDLPVGIRPQEVAQQSLIRHVDRPLDLPYLIHALQLGREAAVHAEDLVVDDGGHRQAVEAVGEELPQPDAEPALALVVEAVDAVDGGTFVVASEEEEVVGVLDLVCQQEADGLDALLPSVDVVAEEEVVGARWEAAILE